MEKWIDISIMIDESYIEYPGDDPIEVETIRTIEKDDFNMKKIHTSMHNGTHVDALSHVLKGTGGIESLDFNRFIGKALVVRPTVVDGIVSTGSIIKEYEAGFDILILDFEHGKKLGKEEYYDFPKFTHDILDFLLKNKIGVLAINIPSPFYVDGHFMDMHRDLLGNDIYIVENLTNLDKLEKYVEFIGLPLSWKGLDGSLIRAVAKNIR